jgi:NaMN:DMB phosphoribosyltransferase
MRLRPLIDFAISLDDGTGALLAVPHLQAAARLLAAAGAE